MGDILNEIQGPFVVQSDNHVLHCDNKHFVNKNLAFQNQGKYHCTGENLVVGTQSVCDIFNESKECVKLKNSYKAQQELYAPVMQQLLKNKNAEISASNLVAAINAVWGSRISTDKLCVAAVSVGEEIILRLSHRRQCVCVADSDHMGRINLLKGLVAEIAKKFVQKYKIQIDPKLALQRYSLMWNLNLLEIGGIYAACNEHGFTLVCKKVLDLVESITMETWESATNRKISDSGRIVFDGSKQWGWINALWTKNMGTRLLMQDLNSQIRTFLNDKETYADGVGCITVHNGLITDIKFDATALVQKLHSNIHILVSPKFLTSLPAAKSSRLLDICIDSFYSHQYNKREELCDLLTKVDPVAREILEQYCSGSGGGGGNPEKEKQDLLKQTVWFRQQSVSRMIKTIGGKSTGNISGDISNLTLAQVRKLAKLIEKELSKTHRKVAWGYRTTTSK